MATLLPSMEMIRSLQVMISASAKTERSMEIVAGPGVDMDLGVSMCLGINSTSPLRPNPMRPLICNDQVFKSHLLALQIFLLSFPNHHVHH